MTGTGFIAIWSDIAPETETDYLHWLTREHTTERLSIPGFLSVRVFRGLHIGTNRFFIFYELQNADVVGSPDYVARLNNPTPWSKRIMPQLGNFVRGGGRLVASSGIGQGSFVSAIPIDRALPDDVEMSMRTLSKIDRVAAIHAFETDAAQTSIPTSEKTLRANDRSFNSLILLKAVDEDALKSAIGALRNVAPALLKGAREEPQLYAGVFSLDRRFVVPAAAATATSST